MRRVDGYRGNLEWNSGLQATRVTQCGHYAYLDGRAACDNVHRHERDGVLLSCTPVGERNRRLAVRAHHLQGADGMVLLRDPGHDGADSSPRREYLVCRLPSPFESARGDKLVFSNGIIILAIFSAILVAAFGGDTSRLIPLYAVGVFLSFTLSQVGMVRHWIKAGRAQRAGGPSHEELAADNPPNLADERKQARHWRKSILINGVGAIATFIVLIVLIITKFIHGAWIVVVLIPVLVMMFRAIHRHYQELGKQLTMEGIQGLRPIRHEVIVPISGIHRGVVRALEYAKAIAPEHVTALSLVGPLIRYLDRRMKAHPDQMLTVVLPEFIPAKWWQHLLHNQTSLLLKGALLFKPEVIVTSVPYHLKH